MMCIVCVLAAGLSTDVIPLFSACFFLSRKKKQNKKNNQPNKQNNKNNNKKQEGHQEECCWAKVAAECDR